MNKVNCLFVFCFCFLSSSLQASNYAITSQSWEGRFGDHLFLYTKLKWLSYKYNLKLFYRPFLYSDKLMLHQEEEHVNAMIERKYRSKCDIWDEGQIKTNGKIDILHICKYFTHISSKDTSYSSSNFYRGIYKSMFEVVIQNPQFADLIKRLIKPIVPIQVLNIPKESISVAMHIRTGGDFEKPLQNELQKNSDEPLKFPPISYYVDNLRKLHQLFNCKPFYVFLFTDDSQPEELAEAILREYNHSNLTFVYRKKDNRHDQNVIEDLWTMIQFDCLIRGQSSYSVMAQLLGNFKLIIEPLSFHWEDERLGIDDVILTAPNYKKCLIDSYDFRIINTSLNSVLDVFEA